MYRKFKGLNGFNNKLICLLFVEKNLKEVLFLQLIFFFKKKGYVLQAYPCNIFSFFLKKKRNNKGSIID